MSQHVVLHRGILTREHVCDWNAKGYSVFSTTSHFLGRLEGGSESVVLTNGRSVTRFESLPDIRTVSELVGSTVIVSEEDSHANTGLSPEVETSVRDARC